MPVSYEAVVVVYNKSIEESVTCKAIDKLKKFNMEVVIVDNSERDFGNSGFCEKKRYTYISMDGNKGLSKAYNAAIDKVKADIIILFDDDTEVTKDYFEELEKDVIEYPDVDIFAPVVYGQDGAIYSPNEFNFLRNHFICSENQEVEQSKFNAIASCLAIRSRVFDGYRFNEKLFVDQVDQYFFCEQRQMGREFMKMDAVINQNFYQRGGFLTADKGWKRVRLRLIDVMRHAQLMGGAKYRILGLIKSAGLSAQIAIKTKSLIVFFKGTCLSLKLFLVPI